MNRLLLLLLSFLIPLNLIDAQQVINFSNINPQEVIVDQDKVDIRVVNDQFKEAAYLYENGCEILINTKDVDKISFWHSFPKLGDDCVLKLAYKRKDDQTNTWKTIKPYPHYGTEIQEKPTFSELSTKSAQQVGELTLRFRLEYPEETSKGSIYIDSITITKLSAKKKQELLEIKNRNARIQEVQGELNKYGVDNCQKVKNQYNDIQVNYINGFYQIKAIAYRTKIIELIGELSNYTKSRSQMGNPIAYKEFENILDSITIRSEPLTLKILQDYKNQLKQFDINKNSNVKSKRKNVFSKIFSVVSNVANVVSAGKIDNIINSVKGIVGTIFNKPALQNKYPIKKWTMDKKKNFDKFVYDNNNMKRIKSELEKGNQYLDGINQFANITKTENEAFLTELIQTAELTSDAIDLSEAADKLIHNYFYEANLTYSNTFIHEELNKTDNRPTEKIRKEIEAYFASITPQCEGVKGLQFYQDDVVKLQALNNNIEEVNLLHESYIKLTDDLKDHYRSLQVGLVERSNQFDPEKNKMSYEKYEEFRATSLKSIEEINSLLNRIFPDESK